jgi:hypothetical protein
MSFTELAQDVVEDSTCPKRGGGRRRVAGFFFLATLFCRTFEKVRCFVPGAGDVTWPLRPIRLG